MQKAIRIKYINIKATCPYFVIIDTVPQNRSLRLVQAIKRMFQYYDGTLAAHRVTKPKNLQFMKELSRFHVPGAKLKVDMVHANPELFGPGNTVPATRERQLQPA